MNTEQFNSLPSEARNFIQENAGCLSCGDPSQLLTRAYELYKTTKKMHTYIVKGGGINYQGENESGVLVAIQPEDSDFEIREKIRIAKLVFDSDPHVFSTFDESAMEKLLASLQDPEVVQLTPAEKGLATKAAKKAAADQAAADQAAAEPAEDEKNDLI